MMEILGNRLDGDAKFYRRARENILNFKFLCGSAGLLPERSGRLVPASAARCLTTALSPGLISDFDQERGAEST
jgi:hypothetical protein